MNRVTTDATVGLYLDDEEEKTKMVCPCKCDCYRKCTSRNTAHVSTQGLAQHYRDSATIHGITRTGEPSLYPFRPILWIVLLLTMTISLGVVLRDQITEFFQYPTRSSFNAEFRAQMEFPAVTICNLNMFKRNITQCDGGQHTVKLDNLFYHLSELHEMQERGVLNRLMLSSFEVLDGQLLADCAANYSNQLDEFLRYCEWQGHGMNCSEIFTPTVTELGLCFTFNDREDKQKMVHDIGEGSGLKVILDIMQDQYYFSATSQAGVKVILHEPGHQAFPQKDGFYVGPGQAAAAVFTRNTRTALPLPFKAFGTGICVDTESETFVNPLTRYSKYSQMSCSEECRINVTAQECKCRHFVEPGNEEFCSPEQLRGCYIPRLNLTYDAENRTLRRKNRFSSTFQHSCDCPPPCRIVSYSPCLSYANFGSDFINKLLYQEKFLPSLDYFRKNIIELNVYYGSMVEYEIAQKPKITAGDILGTVGGNMGLFIGASLLSLVELVEFILVFLVKTGQSACCKQCDDAKIRSESCTGTSMRNVNSEGVH